MSGRLITVPSLKQRKQHIKPHSTSQKQHAPLATHDDCEFSDVSDVENNSDTEEMDQCDYKEKTTSDTMEQQDTSCPGEITPVNDISPTDELDPAAEFSEIQPLEQEEELVENQEISTESATAARAGVVSPVDILITEPAGEETYYEGEDVTSESVAEYEQGEQQDYTSEDVQEVEESYQKPGQPDIEVNESRSEEEYTTETQSETEGTTETTLPSSDLDARGLPYDPNTFYDESGYPYLDEHGKPYDPNLFYLDEQGNKQPYYDENGQPYYDENGQPNSASSYSETDYNPTATGTSYSSAPARPPLPGVSSSKPSRPPLPSSKPTPARPPPPGQSSKPAKPPPPMTKKAEPEVPQPLAPPPEQVKRRKNVEKNYPGAKQEFIDPRFPFKSHFEKKPLVGNAKKGLFNVFKSDKKKKSRYKEKEEQQIEKIINTVDSDEDPIDENSDEWKKFKEIQDRITSSLQSSQNRIQNLNLKQAETENPAANKKDEGGNWATFEAEENAIDDMTSTAAEQPVEDLLGIGSQSTDAFNDGQNEDEVKEGDTQQKLGFDDIADTTGFSDEIILEPTTETKISEPVAEMENDDDFDFSELEMNRSSSKPEIAANIQFSSSEPVETEAEFQTDFVFETKTEDVNTSSTSQVEAPAQIVQETYNLDDDFGFGSSIAPSKPENTKYEFDVFDEHLATRNSTVTSNSENPVNKTTNSSAKFEFGFGDDESLFKDGDAFLKQEKDTDATQETDAAFGGNDNISDAFDDMAPSSSTNPFGSDAFTTSLAKTAIIMETKKTASASITINPRPRPKPQRQETLSGNNPFRRPSQQEADMANDISKVEAPKPEPEAAPAPVVVEAPEKKKGFDPYKTIYPESDKDSSSEDEVDFKIKIKSKTSILDKPTESGPVPLIPAPPVVDVPRSNPFVNYITEPTFRNQMEDDIMPVFNNEPEAWGEQAKAVDLDSAFAVNWANPPPESGMRRSPSPEMEKFEEFCHSPEVLEWKFMMRGPEKKKTKMSQMSKYTSNRWWKEVIVRMFTDKERPVLKVYDLADTKEAIRVVKLEPVMQLSRDKLQYYDKYGKLHILKVNHIVYKEMIGMRTEKFSLKNLTSLVSHKPKQNVALDHLPIRTEVLKFGSFDQKYLRGFMYAVEDAMMKIKSYRDTSLQYTKEEVCCYVQDEYEAKLDKTCIILHQIARTRIFFNAFVTGQTYCVLGINDKWRFGQEVVRRQDIIPIMHDDWINMYEPEFHSCINMEEYEKDHMIKFHPLDGCRFELMRFRTPLRSNRELPLTVNFKTKIDGPRVYMRCDLMIPGFFSSSKNHGSVYCDEIEIRLPIPEEWIYHFRVEKHMKYGSVHSALRKPGKIKGLERITQMAASFLPPSILEVDVGLAKYEHLYKSIVWRIPRLPEKHEGAYKPHLLTCKLLLGQHDPMPAAETLESHFYVEYKMPGSTVSGATVRSISVEHDTSTPERFVKYCAKHVYSVEINYEFGKTKEPALKSILDDPPPGGIDKDSSEDSSDDDDDDDEMDAARAASDVEVTGVGVAMGNLIDTGDLLGLGGDFASLSSSAPPINAPISSADLLMQQLGSFGGADIQMADGDDK